MTAGGDITYTKAVLYGQDISHLTREQLESLTSIGNPLVTVPLGISDKNDNGNGTTVILEATFQNSNLKADLPYTAVGFFAKRGDDAEKLVLVGVANPGAYLVAASPDGVATDALDIKVAIAIGDAASVTAVVDPAGSVTPATLNGAINNLAHDLTAKIDTNQDSTAKALDTKADKTAVADQLATKANQSDLDKTNAEVVKKADSADVTAQLDTKADKTDVANSVKQLQAGIDSKADKSVVDAEIAKIDFTPYAKTVDVDSKLSGYTSTADLTKLLNAKANTVDVYSRSELDKKLLEMSADTDGKVNADQVANMIAGKADKTAVDAELAKKDDITDVDAKINSNVTKLNQAINTKANASDVYTKPQMDTAFGQRDTKIGNNTNVINTINEALKSLIPDDTHAPALPAGFDLNNYFVGWRRSVNTTLKNMPFGWLNDTMYFQGTVAGSDGRFELALYIGDGSNTNPKIAYRFYGWGNWKPWELLADNGDISNLQNQITNATNLANQASQKVDSTLANSFVRKQGMNANGDLVEIRGNATKQTNGGYAFDIWSSDWTASKLKDVLGQLPSKANTSDVNNALNGKANTGDVTALQNKVNVNTPLFREISADSTWEDIFGVTNPNNVLTSLRINPGGSGQLVNDFAAGIGFGGNDTKAVITVDYSSHVARFTAGNGTAPSWSEDVAFKSDINSTNQTVSALQQTIKTLNDTLNSANATIKTLRDTITKQATQITGLQTQVNNQANEISYIKANYIEGKRFAKADESQATAWEKENSQRIAFITDN